MQRTQESSGKVTSGLVQNDTRSKMTGGYCFASWVIRVCGNLGSAEDSHGRMNLRRPPDFLGTRQPREGSHGTVKLPGKLPANPQIPQTPTILSRSSSKCGASQKITNWPHQSLDRDPLRRILSGAQNSLNPKNPRMIISRPLNSSDFKNLRIKKLLG